MVYKLPKEAIGENVLDAGSLTTNLTNSFVPVGGIIMWSGSISNIPSGWALCNGSNGTPDLRNRFVVGAYSDSANSAWPNLAPDDTGGSADATLVSHSHTINNHTHSFSTTSNPGDHDHNVDVLAEFASTHGTWQTGGGYRQVHTGGTHRKPITSDAGGHTHSGTTGNQSDSGTDSQGSSSTNANLPPFYALCYIMRIT